MDNIGIVEALAAGCRKASQELHRAAAWVPEAARQRVRAHARYAEGRPASILAQRGMPVGEGRMDGVQTIAALAVEYWKVSQALDRAANLVPEPKKRQRVRQQADKAAGRLESILAERGMSVVTFDRRAFEVNLPVSAVNAGDFADEEGLVIEQTLEPTIVIDMVPVVTGKVYLARSNANVSRD